MSWALARRVVAFALVIAGVALYLGARLFDWQSCADELANVGGDAVVTKCSPLSRFVSGAPRGILGRRRWAFAIRPSEMLRRNAPHPLKARAHEASGRRRACQPA